MSLPRFGGPDRTAAGRPQIVQFPLSTRFAVLNNPFSSHLGRLGLCVFECTRTIGSLPVVHVSHVRFYSRAVWSLIETGRHLARFENPFANLLRSCIQGYQYLETLVLALSKFGIGIGIDEYLASGIGIDQYLIAYIGIDQNTNNSLKIKGIVYHNLN